MIVPVTVRSFTGKATPIDVDLNTTVADVKAIFAHTGLFKGAIGALAFKGHELRDHRKLSHYNIAAGNILNIFPPSKTPKVSLQFEKPNGKYATIEVDCDATVVQVMRAIEVEEKTQVHKLTFVSSLVDSEDSDIIFISGRQDLPEDASISEYPLTNSIIFIYPPQFNVCLRLYEDGRKLNVQARPQQTLDEFRQEVWLQHTVSIADTVLILVGRELADDDIPVWDLGLVPDCTVHAVPFISFNVETVWGKNLGTMHMHPLTQLSAIRKKLEQDVTLEEIALDTYWFTLDGKEHLKEWRSLWDLDVVVGSTLYMRSRLISVTIVNTMRLTKQIDAEEDETIWGLKERWALVSNGVFGSHKLMYREKVLEDSSTLKEEGLVGGETLFCVPEDPQ